MTYGSSIFTSWFQIICGSQRSHLEFVLWWCGDVKSPQININVKMAALPPRTTIPLTHKLHINTICLLAK